MFVLRKSKHVPLLLSSKGGGESWPLPGREAASAEASVQSSPLSRSPLVVCVPLPCSDPCRIKLHQSPQTQGFGSASLSEFGFGREGCPEFTPSEDLLAGRSQPFPSGKAVAPPLFLPLPGNAPSCWAFPLHFLTHSLQAERPWLDRKVIRGPPLFPALSLSFLPSQNCHSWGQGHVLLTPLQGGSEPLVCPRPPPPGSEFLIASIEGAGTTTLRPTTGL